MTRPTLRWKIAFAISLRRDDIAGQMIDMLEDAAFQDQKVDEHEARRLTDRAEVLLEDATH